jgi:glycosyltransferase involved in cell wall biosynthesis
MRPVAIVNDLLGGQLGERVFWNYMLEGIPELHGFDCKNLGCPSSQISDVARQRIQETMPSDTVIIQNSAFMGKVSDAHFTIAFLQDNLRGMGRLDPTQEWILRTSQIIVSNSQETAKAYPEFNPVAIPIGIDSTIFYVKGNGWESKEKYQIPHNRLVGVFVGDFSEVKGWSEVQRLIASHPEIFFILVSKRAESYQAPNVKCFNRISQNMLADLYNCADFFILGSPIETLCLAAVEAGFCGLPIVMKKTGIFTGFTESQRNSIGVFNDNLAFGFQEFLRDPKRFLPRETLRSLDFGIDSMVSKWRTLLENI